MGLINLRVLILTKYGSFLQTSVDLFASQPSPVSIPVDLFAAPDPVPVLDNNASKSDTTSNTFDPFAAVPMNSFDGPDDPLGTFASHTDPSPIASDKSSPNGAIHEKVDESSVEAEAPPKKEGFQVKSGIWADSLSRGLIDLNITARKYFLTVLPLVWYGMDNTQTGNT